MDTLEFTHLTYGELVKQFGRNTTHTFMSWDQLPEDEREKWTSALAVIHAQIFPHGPPETERYKSEQAGGSKH
jgi:hypothetical protein